MIVAALFAVVSGFLALRYRLKGAYFALATFAFAEMFRLLATSTTSSTGPRVPRSAPGRGVVVVVQFAPDSPNYFWIGLGFLRWRSSSVSCSSAPDGPVRARPCATTKMPPPRSAST